ncbi:MAG: signal peptidase I [Acidimicrobiia bacterium]
MRNLKTRPIRWLASLLLAVAFLVVFAPTTVGGATSYVIVTGNSMSPTYFDGDLVVVRRGDYAVGEIVAFETGRGLVIHRIVGGSAEEGFVMQGDNKENPDPWHPIKDDIVGKHFAQVPEAGRWVQRVTGSPALFGVMIGGLGSLMVWSPRRRRKRRGAHAAEGSRSKPQSVNRVAPMRGAGTTLLVLGTTALLLAGATTYLMLRPLQRMDTIERIEFEHTGEFAYTAQVSSSVVYDSEIISSPSNGSDPTPIYTQLLEDLQIEFRYELASPPPLGVRGTLAAEMRIGAGEGLWTRTISLLPAQEFNGRVASAGFSVEMDRILAIVARAEEQTGFVPGLYQLEVVARVSLEGETAGSAREVFVADLPMELRDTLLLINNDLVVSETVTESEQASVANDIEGFGVSVPLRSARALAGALLVMLLIGGGIYLAGVRRRIGKGEVAKIHLRYSSLIVPVTGTMPNGTRSVDVSSMADLARLARQSEQMVFYDQRSSSEHWFFVPDGSVTYQYHLYTRNEPGE